MAEESSRAWKDQYLLRLPDGMRDRIKAASQANNRSMNAEIVATLLEKYPPPPVEGFQEIYHLFQMLPEDDQKRLIFDALERAGVTKKDLEDGLLSGVTVRRDDPSSD